MSIVDLIAIAFWPVVLGLVWWGWWGWRRRADTGSLAVAWSAASVLVMAGIGSMLIFDIASLWVVFDMFLGMVLFGGLCLAALYGRWSTFSPWIRILLGVFGLGLTVYGVGALAADHLMPKKVVEGRIDKVFVLPLARGADEHVVEINGKLYKATTRLHRTLSVGEQVRAEVGRGSEYIYRLERTDAR